MMWWYKIFYINYCGSNMATPCFLCAAPWFFVVALYLWMRRAASYQLQAMKCCLHHYNRHGCIHEKHDMYFFVTVMKTFRGERMRKWFPKTSNLVCKRSIKNNGWDFQYNLNSTLLIRWITFDWLIVILKVMLRCGFTSQLLMAACYANLVLTFNPAGDSTVGPLLSMRILIFEFDTKIWFVK